LAVTGDPFALFGGNDPSIFKVAIETSSAGTLVCDDALTILFSNRRIETLFGYAPGGLVGLSLEHCCRKSSRPLRVQTLGPSASRRRRGPMANA
jgi:PAS domain S-box